MAYRGRAICNSWDDVDRLFTFLHEKGYKWCDGDSLMDKYHWEETVDMVVLIDEDMTVSRNGLEFHNEGNTMTTDEYLSLFIVDENPEFEF